jgi:ParB-like chromosome segregation protein Spo0J
MKLRKVPPDSIRVPEVRVTARFDPEMYEQFKSSIKEVGALAPVICIEVDNELVLVDGLHRLVEAKQAGEKTVNVAVMPGDEVDVITKNLFLDHLRGKPPVSEMVKAIEVLTKDHGLDSEAVAAKTGLTRDYIEKLQRLGELTPASLASLDEGKIGVGQAHELTRLTDPITQEAVMRQVELYGWKVADLHEHITEILRLQGLKDEVPPPGQMPVEHKIKCFYCKRELDITEIANPNTCRECTYLLLVAIAQAQADAQADQGPPKDTPE